MKIFSLPPSVQPTLTMSGFINDAATPHEARTQFAISASVAAVLGLGIVIASLTLGTSEASEKPIAMSPVTRIGQIAQAQVVAEDLSGSL